MMPGKRTDLKALRSMIAEAERILATATLPEGRVLRAAELLHSAVALADAPREVPLAVVLGAKGGKKTADWGSECGTSWRAGDRAKKIVDKR